MISPLMLGVIFAEAFPEPYGTVAQYGLAGILGYLLLRRFESELTQTGARAERAEAQRDALVEKIFGEVVPLLGQINKDMIPTIERLTDEVRRVNERFQNAERGRGVS